MVLILQVATLGFADIQYEGFILLCMFQGDLLYVTLQIQL